MRTALIAALAKSGNGALRADLSLAGRSVLARQADLLRAQGCERILCLCERTDGAVLQVQRETEAAGLTFQALRGFLHLPALVRADDELVILADGVLPDPALVHALFGAGPPRFVAALPDANPLIAAQGSVFERIDAQHHWAGLLAMRGAPVQQLADFPPDADAISLLLRLALQAGTPCREVPEPSDGQSEWLIATDDTALARQENALIARAAGTIDWRRPSRAAARLAALRFVPAGLEQGPIIAVLLAAVLLLCGLATSALGAGAAGLGLGAAGVFAATFGAVLAGLRRRLSGEAQRPALPERIGPAVDLLSAACVFAALSPWPALAPVGALGPLAIGLARLLAQFTPPTLLAPFCDRAVLLAGLAIAAGLGWLPEACAFLGLALLGGLLLRAGPHLD